MSSRGDIITRVRYNLDDTDSTDYRWPALQLRYLCEERRRKLFTMIEALNPGKQNIVSEDLSIISGTREYDLQLGAHTIKGIEWIAENGVTLDSPVPIKRVEFTERNDFDVSGSLRGGSYFYTYPAVTGGVPFLKVGFLPTPQQTGDDIRVYEVLDIWETSDNLWDAGTALDDENESGLRERWEDLLVLEVTCAAFRAKPPKGDASVVIKEFKNDLADLKGLLIPRETDRAEQNEADEINYEPRD